MTAHHTVSLTCEDECGVSRRHGCLEHFPDRPIEGTVTALRESAALRGWEVMHGKHGRDLCPPCRIAAIKSASEVAEKDATLEQ